MLLIFGFAGNILKCQSKEAPLSLFPFSDDRVHFPFAVNWRTQVFRRGLTKEGLRVTDVSSYG